MIHCGIGTGDVVYRSNPHHDLLPLGEVKHFPTLKKKLHSTYTGILPIYLEVLIAFLWRAEGF